MNHKFIITIMLTVCLFLIGMPNTTFAASTWDGYSFANAVTNSDDSITLTSEGGDTASAAKIYPVGTNYVINMSVRVRSFSGETGIQISNGEVRAMMYFFAGQVVFAGGSTFGYAIGNSWHDYSLVVTGNTAEVYIDDEYVGKTNLQSTTAGGTRIYFWCKNSGSASAIMDVKDVTYVNGIVSDDSTDSTEKPTATEAFYQDFSTLGDWSLTDENVWTEEGGDSGKMVHLSSTEKNKVSSCLLYYNPTDTFEIEYRLRVENYDNETGMKVEYGPYRTFCYFRLNYVNLRAKTGNLQINLDSTVWHTYRLKIDNGYAWFYVDDVLRSEYEMEKYTPSSPVMSFWVKPSAGTGAEMYVDWIRYTPNLNKVSITPMDNSQYVEGQSIALSATASDADNAPEYVDYAANGEVIGRGYAPGYSFEWENAPYGDYEITANYEDTTVSEATNLYIQRNFGGQLILPAVIQPGENVTVRTEAYHGDRDKSVKSVTYTINGQSYTSTDEAGGFAADIGSFEMGNYCLSTTVCDTAGEISYLKDKWILVNPLQAEGAEVGLEYDLSYDVLGSGSISASDGNFVLSLQHTANVTVVTTDEGDVSLPLGSGNYQLAVRSGILNISVNGAFEKSLRLPLSDDAAPIVSENINNLTVSVPEERDIYMQGYGDLESSVASGLTYWSLEFEKTGNTAETIDYYDGAYHLELSVADTIVAMTAPNGTDIEEMVLATLPGGKHIYRITTFNGFAQFFIDNAHITTMRLPKSTQAPAIARKNADAGDVMVLRCEAENYTFSTNFENAKTENDTAYWLGNVSVEEYDLPESSEVTITMKDNIITVLNAPADSTLIAAFYKNGKLVNADINKGTGTITTDISDKKSDSESLEIFLWDMKSVKPLHQKVELPANNLTFVSKIGDAKALLVSNGYALLGGNMKNADVSARIKAGNGGGGAFWLVMRYNSDFANLKIGYNFATENWEIRRRHMTEDKLIASAEDTYGVASSGEWIDMDVELDGQNCVVYVNGQQIFSVPFVGISTHGRVGVMADGRSVMLDRYSVSGDGRIMPGIREFIFEDAPNVEFMGLEDGSVLMISANGTVYRSTDEGNTWSKYPVTGLSYNTIRLQNGNILTIHRVGGPEPDTYWDYAYIYKELGGEPEGPYQIETRVSNRITMNNKLIQTESGRIVFCTGESGHGVEDEGSISVYYSDDGGITWQETQTPLNIHNTGINLQEGKVIELPDGSLRCYIRTDLGVIYSSDSKDGGVTWDLSLKKTPFLATLCALNIERDPVEKDTYYMVWEYDNRHECDIAQFPRFRTSLAVSYDGCNTWEYVTDLSSYDLMIDRTVLTEFRHMNEGLKVFDNYILADVCLYRTSETISGQYVGAAWRIDKEMIRSSKRFPVTYRLPNAELNE